MGWTAKTDDAAAPGGLTAETTKLAYRCIWQMNKPCTVELLLNDDSGAMTQKYGTAYMGKSFITIEQPTNTEIFRGRIIAAEPDIRTGTVSVKGEDWLGQLADRLVTYDTREDLGNSIREVKATPYRNSGTRCNAIWTSGTDYYLQIETDDIGAWSADQFNGKTLIFPYKYMGSQTDKCYAYDETVTPTAGTMNTDTPVAGETNTWATDAAVHNMSQTETAPTSQDFDVVYIFKTLAKESSLVGSIDAIKIHTTLKAFGTDFTNLGVYIKNQVAETWIVVDWPAVSTAMTGTQTFSWEVPADKVASAIETDGTGIIEVKLAALGTGAGNGISLQVDEIYVEVDYTVDTAHTQTHAITATDAPGGVYNRLKLGDDLVTDGIVDWWRFSITQLISVYAADIVDTYDELYALVSDEDVTASTKYVCRHYHRKTPLSILQDQAKADGTDFYLVTDNAGEIMHSLIWNSTYATAGAPTWTDATPLAWTNTRQAIADVVNEWFVEGLVAGDFRVSEEDSDAGSITAYGRRSGYVNNPDIPSNKLADDEADARVERTHDLPFHVAAIVNGYSTVDLGTVIKINSTKLGITNIYYVVTRKEYDSRTAVTQFFLTPREGTSNTLNPRRHLDNLMDDIKGRISSLESGVERVSRYTETWS